LYKKIYISGQRKTQLGNSLVPVIIALAISAVASVAFLNQGSKLTEKNKVLAAQFEVIELIQDWNRLKKIMPFDSSGKRIYEIGRQMVMDESGVPIKNQFGYGLGYSVFRNSITLRYFTDTLSTCKSLAASIPNDLEGLKPLDTNPECQEQIVFMGVYVVLIFLY
jgi:hypothetical protein